MNSLKDYRSTILVALSGGLDSAATVLILREQGFEVRALYIDMTGSAVARAQAEATAYELGVSLEIENVEPLFRQQIIQYTLGSHLRGGTPSPCGRCNPLIKWAVLCRVADRLGIFHIATGHYIRITTHDNKRYVSQGNDPAKDQSYYLWSLPENILERAITPLGSMLKSQVRSYLSERGFNRIGSSSESMSLCFLEGLSYNNFIRTHTNPIPGHVIDSMGQIVGSHSGYQLYTIGQRRGFECSLVGAAVIKIIPVLNQIEVSADSKSLYCDQFLVRDMVIVNEDEFFNAPDMWIKVRGIGRNPEGFCRVEKHQRGVLVHARAWAVAADQPVIFYIGNRVVAGGLVSLQE